MPQDAFTIRHTAIELDKTLKNARVDRINQPEKDSVVFYLRCNNTNLYLTACAKAEFSRLALSYNALPAPAEAPSFCMLLRKHLSRAIITAVTPISDERIISVTFLCKDDLGDTSEKTLYCEIMGKYSNVVLTENGKILGAMKTTSLDSGYPRKIFSGVIYELPKKQEKVSVSDKNAALKVLSDYTGQDLSQYIFENFLGLSKQTADEIIYRYNKTVKIFKIEDFYKFFKDFYEKPNIQPNALFNGKESGVYICYYEHILAEKKSYDSICAALEDYYFVKTSAKDFDVLKNKYIDIINSNIKKQQKKLQIVNDKILSCSDYEKNRLFGQLIISNMYMMKGGESEAVFNDFTKEDYPAVKITLDKTLSPKQNAEKYFKKYDKQKKTLSAVSTQKTELEEIIRYLTQIKKETEDTEEKEDFADIEEELSIFGLIKKEKNKKERKKQTNYRHYLYKGFDIYVGKNNVQNERLTFSADRTDVWLHTKDFHSSHVIIKTYGKPVPDEVLLYAAEVCAYFSDARSVEKVPVDYTLKKHVKKSNGKAIGLVYYTDQNTLFVTPNPHV